MLWWQGVCHEKAGCPSFTAATIQPKLSPFTPDGDFVDNNNIENTITKAYLTTYKAEHCT